MKSLDVKLTTEDGVELAGTYIPGSLPYGAILLHQLPATREVYAQFAESLSRTGCHTLYVDLRGHGDSKGGDWRTFGEEEHKKYLLDLAACADYLKKYNPDMKFAVVGASIGGNAAVIFAEKNPLASLVLLSAGLNYHGLDAAEAVARMPEDLPVYFVSAMDDNDNATQTESLYNMCSSKKKTIQIFKEGGHGANILHANPEFAGSLIGWLKESFA